MTKRNITSLVLAILAGAALWFLPDHVRGKNALFGMNGTLLPASALALIFGLSLLDFVMGIIFSQRTLANKEAMHADDVVLTRASWYGLFLVTFIAVLFTFSLPWIGYFPASAMLVLTLMFGTGGRNIGTILGISLLAILILYCGLRYGLGVHIQVWPDLTRLGG
jgi:hypothetical protein